LALIDERHSFEKLRTGVLFVSDYQKTDSEALENTDSIQEPYSEAYQCFLTCLGADWGSGQRGIKDNLYMLYSHIGTKLPSSSKESRVFERKKLIGNDPVLIMWLMNPNVNVDSFVSKFNAVVFILIEKPGKVLLLQIKCY
jgi:hypothetical protein